MAELFIAPLFTWRSAVASENGPASPTTRHVLLTLSLYMNEKGDSCFPSTKTLAIDTKLSLRAVIEHLQSAAKDGWIAKRERRMSNGQNWRRIEYFAIFPPGVEAFHVKQAHDRGALPQGDDRGALPAENVGEGDAPGSKGGARHSKGRAPDDKPLTRSTSKSTSKSKRAPRRGIPLAFCISDRVAKYAAEHGYTPFLQAHFEEFMGHVEANSPVYANWDAALINCIRRDWGDVRAKMIRSGAVTLGVGKPWWQSAPGIEAKAAELGIAQGDDAFPNFKARVFDAAGRGPWNEAQAAQRVVAEAHQRAGA